MHALRLRPVVLPSFPEALAALREREVDLMATVGYEPSREAYMAYTLGTAPNPGAIIGRAADTRFADNPTLNGRRVAPSGSRGAVGATDLNVLPNIMVDRIEILKDGASSIYGSDAVAGVVNFITRTRVDRPEITARMNFIDGASQVDIQGIAGVKAAGGDLVLAASYYKSTRLGTDERDFSQAKTFGRPSWHSVSGFGMPGSYILPGGSTVADPDCLNAAFPDSFKNSPTDRCRFDFSGYFDLIPQERRIQAMATWNGSVWVVVRSVWVCVFMWLPSFRSAGTGRVEGTASV